MSASSSQVPQGWHFRQGPRARQFRSPAVWMIIGTIVASYFVQLTYLFFLDSLAFDRTFAYHTITFMQGDWWQIWTYAWLHAEYMPLHILINLWMILILGPSLERTIGTVRFLVLYLLAAPASVLAFEWWHLGQPVSLIGASGCAFALLTATAVQFPHRTVGVLILFLFPVKMRLATFAWILCAVEYAMMVMGWLPFIAHSAHLGGAIAGFALGWYFRPERYSPLHQEETQRKLKSQIGPSKSVELLPPPSR